MADEADRGPTDDARDPDGDDPPTPPAGPSDHSLLRNIRGGDQQAATLFYQRYVGRLRALARRRHPADLNARFDAEEVVQSVLGSFFRKVIHGSYDVPAGEELWSLLLVITMNKIRAKGAHHRAIKRDARRTAGGEVLDLVPDLLGSDDEAYRELKLSVEEALDQLPERHSRALRLRMADYSVEEIAKALGRSQRSAERLLQEGRKALARLLQD